MPQPRLSDVHVDRPMTSVSIAYIQGEDKFIADKIFANIPVQNASDSYYEYEKEDWFRDDMEIRAPGTESSGSGYRINANSKYSIDVWAMHKDVDDQTRSNYDKPLDADRDATIFLSQKAMLRKEKHFASKYFKTGIWTGTSSGTDIVPATKWDNAASDPIVDIEKEIDAMEEKTSFTPNTLIVSKNVHRALKNNAAILDRFKYTQKGVLTAEILAMLFGVDRYIVAKATNNLAEEGKVANMKFIYGDGALLCYSNPTPSIMQPSAGYTFSWRGYLSATALGSRMKKFRMDHLESDRLEIDMAFDMKQTGADLGGFFDQVLTP